MTQRKKEEYGLTEVEKERDRIIQKYDQKLRPFNNKALEPGSPECEQRNAILGEYQSELNELAEKYYTPERLDTLDELKEFLGDKITFLKMCRTAQKIKTGIDEYPVGLLEGAENYRQKALKAVNKLFKKTILSPQQIQQIKLSDLLTGLELLELLVDAEKKAAYTDREQKKGEKAQKPKYQHSEDYTSVVWFGKTYNFTKTQALCVKHLWAEWEKDEGLGLSEKTIGEKIATDSDNYKLKHTFRVRHGKKYRQHPAWGTMIVSCGKGVFCIKSPKK